MCVYSFSFLIYILRKRANTYEPIYLIDIGKILLTEFVALSQIPDRYSAIEHLTKDRMVGIKVLESLRQILIISV